MTEQEAHADTVTLNEQAQNRLAALKLVYPEKNFQLIDGTGGSDGMIFVEEGKPDVVYKVTQGWRLLYGEAEARALYLMAQQGIAPTFVEYIPADSRQDTYYDRYPDSRGQDEHSLKPFLEYYFGDDFMMRTEFQAQGLEHSILVMGRVNFQQEESINIDIKEKIQEMLRLAKEVIALKLSLNDTELQFDYPTRRYLFLDCGGVKVAKKVDTKYILETLLWIADHIAGNVAEKNELEKIAFRVVEGSVQLM